MIDIDAEAEEMSDTIAINILKRARRLIDSPQSWVKGKYCDTVGGVDCFCSLGAIFREEGETEPDIDPVDLLSVEVPKGFSGVVDFNDDPSTTHADVLALFDRAIARAEGA